MNQNHKSDEVLISEHGFRSRLNAHISREELVELLLKTLLRLENETNPAGGLISAQDKSEKAFVALVTAGKLVDDIAGWAIDHAIGMAIAGLGFPEHHASPEADQTAYKQHVLAADMHIHELIGGLQRENFSPFSPEAAKLALLNIVRGNSANLPLTLRDQVVEGLRALEFGEATPIFRKKTNRNKVLYRELSLQLKAIAFIEYRYLTGMKKEDAEVHVAAAYDKSREAVRSWEKSIRRRLGALTLSKTKAVVNHTVRLSESAAKLGKSIQSEYAEQIYGAEALKCDAAEHKKLLREV